MTLSLTTGRIYYPVLHTQARDLVDRAGNMSINISVYHHLLTLEGCELHTGDNILPNSTIILGLSSRGGTRSHGQFQCLDELASVFQTSSLNTMYKQTLRKWSQVSTNWHLQVLLSLEHSQWGREFKTKANNASHIQAQHCRLKLPLEVEDSVNTVLKHTLCFPASQQTCTAGIKYLWSALLRPPFGVSVRIFTDGQTCSVLRVAMRTMRLHGYQRTPWDPRPSVFPVPHDDEIEGDGARIEYLTLVVALVHSAGWMSIMDLRPHPGPGEIPNLWPDLRFLGPVLLHFYKDMSLTIGPVDGSPPQFHDHLASDSSWGGIQSQGANCCQRLLETLDRVSLLTLLGGLANRNWHWLGTQCRAAAPTSLHSIRISDRGLRFEWNADL